MLINANAPPATLGFREKIVAAGFCQVAALNAWEAAASQMEPGVAIQILPASRPAAIWASARRK